MLRVGLTGGIASGKSLVARVFKDLGAHLVDADRIVHELLEPGSEAGREVLDCFGEEILLPDGRIDRRKLGAIVFNDADKRARLNQCLHPKVFEAYQAQVRRVCNRSPHAIIVLDAALLIETGYHRGMDRVVVVYADPEQQLERLISRNGFTKEEALARIQSQMPLADKRRFADYVIDNTGTRERTVQQAREVYSRLKQEAEKHS